MSFQLPSLTRKGLVFVVTCACALCLVIFTFAKADAGDIRVVYSLDNRQNDQEIIRLINEADKYVYFAIYYFSQKNIAEALIRAKNRGVKIWGISDLAASTDANKEVLAKLGSVGINVESQKHVDGIMHIKALVTDKAYASGSYNWTSAATEANDEILEIGTNRDVHDQYLDIIKRILFKNQ